MSSLDKLEKDILGRITSSSTPAELEALSAALKSVVEARRSTDDRATHQNYRLEHLKSLAALLVPLASLLALPVSIVVGGLQIRSTQDQARETIKASQDQAIAQSEDTQWRDFVKSVSRPPEQIFADATIAPRLKEFEASRRYGLTAREIAITLMGRAVNKESFYQLFNYVFPRADDDNLDQAMELSRDIYSTKHSLEEECAAMYSTVKVYGCAEGDNDAQVDSILHGAKDVQQSTIQRFTTLRQALLDLGYESSYLSAAFAQAIRDRLGGRQAARRAPRKGLDLSNAVLMSIDLSGVDFSAANISGTVFDTVNLKGADLRARKAENVEFRGSNWWDAKAIGAQMLLEVIQYNNPMYSSDIVLSTVPGGDEATRTRYVEKVQRLCAASGAACPTDIPYGPSAP